MTFKYISYFKWGVHVSLYEATVTNKILTAQIILFFLHLHTFYIEHCAFLTEEWPKSDNFTKYAVCFVFNLPWCQTAQFFYYQKLHSNLAPSSFCLKGKGCFFHRSFESIMVGTLLQRCFTVTSIGRQCVGGAILFFNSFEFERLYHNTEYSQQLYSNILI